MLCPAVAQRRMKLHPFWSSSESWRAARSPGLRLLSFRSGARWFANRFRRMLPHAPPVVVAPDVTASSVKEACLCFRPRTVFIVWLAAYARCNAEVRKPHFRDELFPATFGRPLGGAHPVGEKQNQPFQALVSMRP